MDLVMLRLTLLLCIGMFAALMIAGQDRGQLRPGLARAALSGAEPTAPVNTAAAEEPAVLVPASATPRDATVVARADTAPAPYVAPDRTVVTAVDEPVFSLSAIGTEAVPGAGVTPRPRPATLASSPSPQPESVAGSDGTIWYINADSVNVRAAPSTTADVLDKLARGEATLVVQSVDADWARIVIQGDGVEGYVALRYLTPEAP